MPLSQEVQVIPGCCAAILIGGQSKRMGRDKALLETCEGPLFAAVARQLQDHFRAVRPVGSLPCDLPDVPGLHLFPPVPDVLPERSSLNGILSALESSTCPWVAVFACDMPNVCYPLLLHMAGLRRGDADVIAVRDRQGDLQPFHAFWHVRCAAVLHDAASRGELGLQKAMKKLSVVTVGPKDWERFDPEGRFLLNLNTPEELEAWLASRK